MKQVKRRLLTAVGAGGLALLLAGQAPAVTLPGVVTEIPEEPGKTVAGVQVAKASPDLLSFEVPLYVTMAAVEGPALVCPDNYSIRNSSKAPDGSDVAIAVTGITVQKSPGSAWTLTDGVPVGKELSFSVGHVPLPSLTDADWTPVNIKVDGSAFYSTSSNQYLPIPSTDPGLRVPLAGTLPDGWTPGNKAAAPQFRLQYTVSMLDTGGHPMEVIYQGPEKGEAQQSGTPAEAAGN